MLGVGTVTWTTVVESCAGVVVGVGACTGFVGVDWLSGDATAVSPAATRLGTVEIERVVGTATPVKVRRVVISVVDSEGVEVAGDDGSGVDTVGIAAVGVDAIGLDATGVDATGLDAWRVETAGVDATVVDATGLDAWRVELAGVDIGVLSTMVVWTVLAVAATVGLTVVDTDAG